ncbi:MAG TPA: hypothetical protein VGJ13_19875 [Pseudonocardiaceae bacterium]|jgi:hypothetical protein
MHVTAFTVAGSPDTPNEDWYATTSDLIVVLDGATIRTDTGCVHGAAWYARKLGGAILAGAADRGAPLDDVLANAIRDVAALHPHCDLTHAGTPSAGAAIVRLDGRALRYLVLGDVTVVLDAHNGGTMWISDQRISDSARVERDEVDRHLIGSPEKVDALIAMKRAELAARNREYWIAAADPSVVEYALTGEVRLSDGGRLAVLTDGAARWVDLFRCGNWSGGLKVLSSSGPQWFIEHLVRAVEDSDPLGARYPRNKRSDDATAVYAEPTSRIPERPAQTDEERLYAGSDLAMRLSSEKLYGDGLLVKAGTSQVE